MGSIMLQGTSTGVGKTTIATALCRILRQDGYSVMPFKPQSFSNTSHITPEGLEITSRIVPQAAAAKQPVNILMNPVLVKPSVNNKYLVMILGKTYETMSLTEYIQNMPSFADIVTSSYEMIASQCDHVIVGGMGNPTEPFLSDMDIGNMNFAEKSDMPVILVADISKGGAAASITGTLALLGARGKRIGGVIINRVREKKLIKDIERTIGIPILGTLPYMPNIEVDDTFQEEVSVEIIRLPNMRNLSGVQPLEDRTDVSVKYINNPSKSKNPDIIIVPDSRNKTAAIDFLRESGLDMLVRQLAIESKLIIGLGSGFSIMGTDELGLIDMHTIQQEKLVENDAWDDLGENPSPYFYGLQRIRISGYERRFDLPILGPTARPATGISGAFSAAGNVFGTHVNGLFDNEAFLDGLLLNIKTIKGLTNNTAPMTPARRQDIAIDALADIFRENLDMEKIYQIIGD